MHNDHHGSPARSKSPCMPHHQRGLTSPSSADLLELVTITGAVERDEVLAIHEAFPTMRIEYGLLLGERKMGSPRFPSEDQLRRLATIEGLSFSAHVVGRWLRDLLKGGGDIWEIVPRFLFSRIQLNMSPYLAKARFDPAKLVTNSALNGHSVIVQCAEPNAALTELVTHAREASMDINVLFDASGGRGVQRSDGFPMPLPGTFTGFAGGLGPDNVAAHLARLAEEVSAPIWIDAESRLRTDDVLDLAKVNAFLEAVGPYTRHEATPCRFSLSASQY